jgi:hypothetical protein
MTINLRAKKMMTPQQKLKWAILSKSAEWDGDLPPEFSCINVDDLYEKLCNEDLHWDAKNEIRSGELETGLSCEVSRHYEAKAVAMKFPDGSWVGWTYWYGGGKHANPEVIDWVDDAYELECTEEEKVVVVRSFVKRENNEVGNANG